MADNATLPLLMVYELDDVSGRHHVICFQDPVHAGSMGIDVRAIVGRFEPTASGGFDPAKFQFNTAFVNLVADFMNAVVIHDPALAEEATLANEGRLEVIDPRCAAANMGDIPLTDILGWFAVNNAGTIEKESFLYNHNHLWFSPESGTSGLLSLRPFYDFVHGGDDQRRA